MTSFTGVESQPALSADGKQLAFAWLGEPPDLQGVYVKLVAGGAPPLRISATGKASAFPTWSPDAARVAYVRATGSVTEILVAPALGGPERRVAQYTGPPSSISWSPNGKWIAASVPEPAGANATSLQLVSLETGEQHRLTRAPEGTRDISPRFSPDGDKVAFVRNTGTFSSLPFWVPIDPAGVPSGEPRQIGGRHLYTYTVDWFPDGKSVIIPVIAGATCQYWKIPIGTGTPDRLPIEFPIDLTSTSSSGISLRGSRLAAVVNNSQDDIGRLEWNQTTARFQSAEFYGSSRTDGEVQVSPNGQWVVLTSTRSGAREIWRANRDGSQALLLTSMPDHRIGSPRWSFDNQWIAFDAAVEGSTQIYVVSAEGGKARQVTSGSIGHVRPSFSFDGKWIYLRAGPNPGISRIPFAGGTVESVTKHGYEAFESPDGRWLYYFAQQGIAAGIFRVPTTGGSEQLILRDPRATAWALAGKHVYVGMGAASDPGYILRIDPESHRSEEVYRFPPKVRRFSYYATSLAVSPDERTIYHTGAKRNEADIILVDNFR